jgi:hypothetical protein
VPCEWASLFIGALLGNLEGVRLPRLLRENKVYLGSLLDPEIIKILNPSEVLVSFGHIHLGPFFWTQRILEDSVWVSSATLVGTGLL